MVKLKKTKDFTMKYSKILFILLILLLGNGCVKRDKVKPSTIIVNHQRPNTNIVTHQEPQVIIEQQPQVITQQPQIITQQPPQIIQPQPQPQQLSQVQQALMEVSRIRSPYLSGIYANNPKLRRFIDEMVRKYNFRRDYLYGLFSSVNRDVKALKKYNVIGKPKSKQKENSVGSWDRYPRFVTEDRIRNGIEFWNNNRYYLEKAYYIYHVPPEYILGIIGVETNFGRNTGKHRLIDALTSLSLEYKKRSSFFTKQLEEYLLLTKEQKMNPLKIRGSYGGAFGIVQFMPDSFRKYAVDFNGDGIANLFDPADAIGSTANFFVNKGKWQPNLPVAMRVLYPKKRLYGIKTGYKTEYAQSYLKSLGMRPTSDFNGYRGPVSLIKLSHYDRDELWWGTKNFYAIARYNPRDYYVMSVHLLAQAIKNRYYQIYGQ
jgi:membrane-bound lytic murein transglycosylase B